MELNKKQIDKFKEIHKKYGVFDNCSEELIKKIANGVANYYLTLYEIYNQNKRDDYWKNTTTIKAHGGIELSGVSNYHISGTFMSSLSGSIIL